MRLITSKLTPNGQLSDDDRTSLQKVYDNIEEYLLHRDPLRTFAKDELEAKLQATNWAVWG
jgi:hypothetical protein